MNSCDERGVKRMRRYDEGGVVVCVKVAREPMVASTRSNSRKAWFTGWSFQSWFGTLAQVEIRIRQDGGKIFDCHVLEAMLYVLRQRRMALTLAAGTMKSALLCAKSG